MLRYIPRSENMDSAMTTMRKARPSSRRKFGGFLDDVLDTRHPRFEKGSIDTSSIDSIRPGNASGGPNHPLSVFD